MCTIHVLLKRSQVYLLPTSMIIITQKVVFVFKKLLKGFWKKSLEMMN